MGKFIDITNKRYGKLTAIKATDKRTKNGGIVWLFKCDCGNEKHIAAHSVINQGVKSCGCITRTHGMSKTRLFHIWVDMRQRCNNNKHPQFHLWGGKGVRVCDEWNDDFSNFVTWALANGYKETLSIERKDGNGNYDPSNCVWATAREQARNISTNHIITINGVSKPLCDWLESSPITACTYHRRIKMGMTDEEALFTPHLRKRGKSNA